MQLKWNKERENKKDNQTQCNNTQTNKTKEKNKHWQPIVYIGGCKQDTMSQHDYFRKGLHVFFPKRNYFIWMNFGTMFLTIFFIINVYSCPNIWHVFLFVIFE